LVDLERCKAVLIFFLKRVEERSWTFRPVRF
jgi:hypothetical protein